VFIIYWVFAIILFSISKDPISKSTKKPHIPLPVVIIHRAWRASMRSRQCELGRSSIASMIQETFLSA